MAIASKEEREIKRKLKEGTENQTNLDIQPSNNNSINKPNEVEELKKLLAEQAEQLKEQKKINRELKIIHTLIAPKREIDGIPNVPYNTKVHADIVEFINKYTKGSQNIIMNFLMRLAIKIIKEQLQHGSIQINAKGIVQDND